MGKGIKIMDKKAVRTGWYSKKADAEIGHAVYTNLAGEKIKITCVTEGKKDSGTLWDDVECVGSIIRFVEGNWKRGIYNAF